MEEQKRYNIVAIFKKTLAHMPKKRRKQFWLLLAGMILLGGLETISAGVLAFFATFITNPVSILQNPQLLKFAKFLNFEKILDFKHMLLITGSAAIGLILLKNLVQGVIVYLSDRYSARSAAFFGGRLLEGYLEMPYEVHLSSNSADLALSVIWRYQMYTFLKFSLKGMSNILVVSILLMAILLIEPLVFVPVLFVLAVIGYFLFTRIRTYLDRTAAKVMAYRQSINKEVQKALHGIKDVKVYGRQHLFNEVYNQNAYKEARLDAIQQVLSEVSTWILETVGVIIIVASVCILYFLLSASTIKTTGIIALLAVAAWRILPAITKIIASMTNARKALPYMDYNLERLEEILSYDHYRTASHGETFPYEFVNNLRLENITFQYKGAFQPVLCNLNLDISKGRSIGIVGFSGAGKSTVADILIGLLQPTGGQLMIDGNKVEQKSIPAWMKKIGYVPQFPYICDGTLAENVAFGYRGEDIDRKRVLDCCQKAAMEDFLEDLPEGIDTAIGERGVKLSGGQRQRVAIARALYNHPEVIIFDEATSSLDTKSEKAVQKTIYDLKGKQTLIVIAHRLSTVENCDEVIWLDKGQIRKIGAPHEVLPEYRKKMREENVQPLNDACVGVRINA